MTMATHQLEYLLSFRFKPLWSQDVYSTQTPQGNHSTAPQSHRSHAQPNSASSLRHELPQAGNNRWIEKIRMGGNKITTRGSICPHPRCPAEATVTRWFLKPRHIVNCHPNLSSECEVLGRSSVGFTDARKMHVSAPQEETLHHEVH